MLSILKDAWKTVEKLYREERINSERCLQAALYHALSLKLPQSQTILVEPGFNACVPDLVIRDNTSVKCIFELKCAPHWWMSGPDLKRDLEKLAYYSKTQEPVKLDVFGPDRIYDPSTAKWEPLMPTYQINEDTWFCFGALCRYDSIAASMEKLVELFGPALPERFCLLLGSMNPQEIERCKFEIFPTPANQSLLST